MKVERELMGGMKAGGWGRIGRKTTQDENGCCLSVKSHLKFQRQEGAMNFTQKLVLFSSHLSAFGQEGGMTLSI